MKNFEKALSKTFEKGLSKRFETFSKVEGYAEHTLYRIKRGVAL